MKVDFLSLSLFVNRWFANPPLQEYSLITENINNEKHQQERELSNKFKDGVTLQVTPKKRTAKDE